MDILLNFGFAWIAVLFAILASIIYIFRIIIVKLKLKNTVLNKVNKSLRKHHKLIGIIVVIAGLIHGYFSGESIFTVNLGTIAAIISILLGLNWSMRKRLSKYKGWIYYHRLLTVAFAITIVLHIYDVGGIQVFNVLFDNNGGNSSVISNSIGATDNSNNNVVNNDNTVNGSNESSSTENSNTTNDNAEKSEIIDSANKELMGGNYEDGTYTGEATGYRDGLEVQIVIKDNTITDVEVISSNEVNSRYYQKAFDTVPQRIVDNQSTDVDVTSGATFSSIGIMNAVNNALSKAIISGNVPEDQALPANRGHGPRG